MTARTRISGDYELLQALGSSNAVRNTIVSTTAISEDRGSIVKITLGTAVTYTINADSDDLTFAIGTKITVVQGGAGAMTMTPGAGVTFVKLAAKTLATGAIYARVTAEKIAANTWLIAGDLA